MKKLITTTSVILFALVVMILLNILSLYMLHEARENVRGDRPGIGRDRGGPKYFIIKELGFSQDQIAEYEELVKEHRRIVKQTRRDNRKLKKELFGLLNLPPDNPRVQKLMKEISLNDEKLETATFEHFREVRALCNEKQKKELDRIINRVLDMMSRGKPPHRPLPPPPGHR